MMRHDRDFYSGTTQ